MNPNDDYLSQEENKIFSQNLQGQQQAAAQSDSDTEEGTVALVEPRGDSDSDFEYDEELNTDRGREPMDIFEAVKKLNSERVVELLDENVFLVIAVDDIGNTPLHYAASTQDLDITLELLSAFLLSDNVDMLNSDEETPLLIAARLSTSEILEAFIMEGANVKALDKFGRSTLYNAAENNDFKIVELLLGNGAKDIINIIDQRTENTPLHIAVEKGNFEITKKLLESGAEVDPLNANKKTPLSIAIENNLPDVVDLLKEYGADIDLVNVEEQIDIKLAKDEGIMDLAKLSIAQVSPEKIPSSPRDSRDVPSVKDEKKKGNNKSKVVKL